MRLELPQYHKTAITTHMHFPEKGPLERERAFHLQIKTITITVHQEKEKEALEKAREVLCRRLKMTMSMLTFLLVKAKVVL